MAGLVFGLAGAGIGSAFGYASAGWLIGSTIGNLLFPPSVPDQNIEGPRLNDLRVQVSTYGQMIPQVWGVKRLAGNVIWSPGIEERQTVTSQDAGGKGGGGGGTVTQTSYSYYADLAVGICRGPIVGIRRIWANSELIYNAGDDAASTDIAASTVNAAAIRVYTGSESQGQDPLIVAHKGATNTPAYRGLAYIVFDDLALARYGNRPPNLEFEVVTAGTLADLAVPTAATLGAADGSTFRVLGANGNVYAGATTTGGHAIRWNFYSGGKAGTYVPPSYTYLPVGVTPEGAAIATGSFAGVLAVLREDGSVARYTGGASNMGNGGVLAEADVWWCRGDSSASTTLYRAAVDHEVLQVNSLTPITGLVVTGLARNGLAVGGRVYVLASYTIGGQVYIGYVNRTSLSFVPLVAITSIAGFLVARDGTIWMGPNNSSSDRDEIRQYSADGALLQTITLPTVASAGWDLFEDRLGLIWAVGLTGFGSNRRAYCINPGTAELLYTSQDFLGTALGFTDDNRLVVWDTVSGNFVLKEVERLPRLTSTTVSLSTIVSEICQQAGLDAGDLSLSALTDQVDGYLLSRVGSARAGLEPLALVYAWDMIESDLKAKAVKRGGAVVATIAEDELAAHMAGDSMPVALSPVRKLETELPREVRVVYADKDNAHQQGMQYARRLTGQSKQIETIETTVAMNSTGAARLAQRVLDERWAQRVAMQWATTRKYAHFEPMDLWQISKGGATWIVLAGRKDEGRGVIEWQGVTEDVAVLSQGAVGVAPPPLTQSVTGVVPTVLRLLDIPLLRDVDDEAGFYAAAAGVADAWRGAELWKSIDGGATYARGETAFLAAAVMGAAVTALPNFAGGNVVDEHSRVEVLVVGQLAGVTLEQMLAGANAAYLGGEIITFRDATLVSAGRYRLSGVLRGRRGTEQYMATHAIGDPFALLSSSTVQRVLATSAEVGQARSYKAPAFGQSLAQAAAVAFTNAAVGLKPLSPVHLAGGRNAAGDVVVKWVRRTRVGGEWRDFVDAQLGEASEAYEAEVWASGYVTLKRTITGLTSATFTYTAAQQTTDFGSTQATVHVRVFQVSAVVGRGFPAQGSI